MGFFNIGDIFRNNLFQNLRSTDYCIFYLNIFFILVIIKASALKSTTNTDKVLQQILSQQQLIKSQNFFPQKLRVCAPEVLR